MNDKFVDYLMLNLLASLLTKVCIFSQFLNLKYLSTNYNVIFLSKT